MIIYQGVYGKTMLKGIVQSIPFLKATIHRVCTIYLQRQCHFDFWLFSSCFKHVHNHLKN